MKTALILLAIVWLLDGFDIVPYLLAYTLAVALALAGVLIWIM